MSLLSEKRQAGRRVPVIRNRKLIVSVEYLLSAGGDRMAIFGIILMVVTILLLVGLVPVQSDGRSWQRSGSGILGAFLVVALLLTVTVQM
jgi:hypothetical protein